MKTGLLMTLTGAFYIGLISFNVSGVFGNFLMYSPLIWYAVIQSEFNFCRIIEDNFLKFNDFIYKLCYVDGHWR